MKKILGFAFAYLLLPFLIYQYAATGVPVYKWILGFFVWAYFLLMLMFTTIMSVRKLKMTPDEALKLREKIGSRTVAGMVHLAMGMVIGYTIFVYVNSILGAVYVASLLMIQILRWRLLNGRI